MPSSLQPSRLARYSLAATAAAAGSGAAAVADVTSGTFDLSFGRSAGTNFFNGFSSISPGSASVALAMSDFTLYVGGSADATIADAMVSMSIFDANSDSGYFDESMVDAGAFWSASAETSCEFSARIFKRNTNSSLGTSTIWTNPDATGTKFATFLFEADGGDIYGWIQLDWEVTDSDNWRLTIGNWAYSDEGPLAAGSTGAPVVPGLGGLAALAVGAAGVRGRRQRVAG